MLAPGEYVIDPAPVAPPPPRPAAALPRSSATPAADEDDEPQTFLNRLLRALGAIHT
jgi:hypothetical protein